MDINQKIHFLENVSLSSLSTFNIGGKAKQFIRVSNPDELSEVVQWAKENNLEYEVFAGGSNVVFPDEGLACLVIQVLGGNVQRQENKCMVDAGVLLMDVINEAIKYGLSGLESLSGIPGTIGGAVVGNAGAYGHSISEVVEKAQVFNGEKIYWMTNSECEFDYRESIFKKNKLIILKVVCLFQKGNNEDLQKISREIIKMREKKYKPGLKCPGSFFKNVLVKYVSEKSLTLIDQSKIIDGKIPTGYLLSEVGARGMRVGGIQIADFHGNLFINTGGGTARDVKELSSILKAKVKAKFGIELEEEIRYF